MSQDLSDADTELLLSTLFAELAKRCKYDLKLIN